MKQNEPTISFFKIDNALPSFPFSVISDTNLCAATSVSLAFCGVKVHPPTRFESSSTLEMVPLCATQRSFTLSGCALSRSLYPTVEYLTCPIAE